MLSRGDTCYSLKIGKYGPCGATIAEVIYGPKPQRVVYWSGSDNRGNPASVSSCDDHAGKYRKGRRCAHPCVVIGGTNHNTNSARGHAAHFHVTDAKDIAKAILKAIRETEK